MPAAFQRLIALFFITCLLQACGHKATLFENLSPSSTNIHFENKLVKQEGFGILYYLYYYNGGGVSIGDINNDGLPDIYFTANSPGNNKLYLNKGNFEFEDITLSAGVAGSSDWCTGSTMADVNGDGYLDIYVSCVSKLRGLKGHNELFINNGPSKDKDGKTIFTFTESAAQYGLDFSGFSTQAAFFDFDHDGDLDCYLLNQSHNPNQNIVDTSNRRRFDPEAGDRLFRNDMNGTAKKFTDVSATAGIYQSNLGYGLGLSIGDFNNDGWDDIYVGNDFHENDYYYLNNGNGTFTESGSKAFRHYSRFSMGNDAADFNNDGQLDIVTVDMLPPEEKILKTYGSDEHADIYNYKILHNGFQNQFSKNCLQVNNGNGKSFSDVGLMSNISATDWSWSPLFADFDNDGNKDLFISSGIVKRPVDLDYVRFISDLYRKKAVDKTSEYDDLALEKMPDGSSHPFLFKGTGSYGFTDYSDAWGTGKMKGYYNGAAYADLNNDGNIDIVINALNAPAVILKNTAPVKNYLSVQLKGAGANTSGIGAKVYIFQKGKIQFQQQMLTRGFQSSSSPGIHFGLDSIKTIDSLLVVWPRQEYQLLKNIKAGVSLILKESDAKDSFSYQQFFPSHVDQLKDISSNIRCNWRHRENNFVDFNVQYLIPHEESTRGPRIAVADVNKDGLEDFFVCGAKNQPGVLMIQARDGNFNSVDTAVFNQLRSSELVDAVFADVNGDGYPELYLVSGGNEYADGNPALADHLLINDGSGHFSISANALPSVLKNKTVVAAADFDKDGDIDFFIGGFCDASEYGISQPSYLLINDGQGKFTVAGKNIVDLDSAGMTTCATFADIDKDGWPDLIVSGEWMPIRIYFNKQGKFLATDIPNSTGLWQSLLVTDANGDGKPDIIAGNWGHNSKLYAGKNSPLKMYVKDYDKNGSVEQVMAYTENGKEYPFLAKDELERKLPVLKKYYLTYSEVAGQTIQYLLFDLLKDAKEWKAEVLGSSIFINEGNAQFIRNDLPEELQLAPIFALDSLPGPTRTYIAAGNFYGIIPYEGRYDALQPTIFNTGKNGNVQIGSMLPGIDGEIRDAKWIHYRGRHVLIAGRNNNSLLFLEDVRKNQP